MLVPQSSMDTPQYDAEKGLGSGAILREKAARNVDEVAQRDQGIFRLKHTHNTQPDSQGS